MPERPETLPRCVLQSVHAPNMSWLRRSAVLGSSGCVKLQTDPKRTFQRLLSVENLVTNANMPTDIQIAAPAKLSARAATHAVEESAYPDQDPNAPLDTRSTMESVSISTAASTIQAILLARRRSQMFLRAPRLAAKPRTAYMPSLTEMALALVIFLTIPTVPIK
jgi:hypothetical protein